MHPAPYFSPSLICMDLTRVGEQLIDLEGRADYLHVDVMDGRFVRNYALSPKFVEQIRPLTTCAIDVHLMAYEPAELVRSCITAGADVVSLHAETIGGEAFRLIDTIHTAGRRAGVVLNPETPVSVIEPYLGRLDKVTVMTVDPGYAGERFIPEMLDKIRLLRQLKADRGRSYLLEADGQGNRTTYARLNDAGVEVFIVGTSGLFSLATDLAEAWDQMCREFETATAARG